MKKIFFIILMLNICLLCYAEDSVKLTLGNNNKTDEEKTFENENLGLLLTLQYDEGENNKYKTLLIVRNKGKLIVRKEFEKIIVFDEKFYTLEKKEVKSKHNVEYEKTITIEKDNETVEKVNQYTDIFEDISSKYYLKKYQPNYKSFNKELKGNSIEEIGEIEFGVSFINRNFRSNFTAGASWASYKIYGGESCAVYRDNKEIEIKDIFFDKDISFEDFFKEEISKSKQKELNIEKENWIIKHSEGLWKAFFIPNPEYSKSSLSNEENWIEISKPLPSKIVGDNSLYPEWNLIKNIKDVNDAVSYKKYNALILFFDDRIEGYENADKDLENPNIIIKFNNPKVISTQWCTGKTILKWEKELGIKK